MLTKTSGPNQNTSLQIINSCDIFPLTNACKMAMLFCKDITETLLVHAKQFIVNSGYAIV